jgi:hypothetical protein
MVPVVDIKLQLDPNGIPPVMMNVLKQGPGKMQVHDLIMVANECGYKVTIVIENQGGGFA